MKKKYTTPEMEMMQMPKLSVIATSGPGQGEGDGGNNPQGNRRGQADWGDDDE